MAKRVVPFVLVFVLAMSCSVDVGQDVDREGRRDEVVVYTAYSAVDKEAVQKDNDESYYNPFVKAGGTGISGKSPPPEDDLPQKKWGGRIGKTPSPV